MNTTDKYLAIRDQILARLGWPEPILPGVEYIGEGSSASHELLELFDEMCMLPDITAPAVVERAIAKLESIRKRDFSAFYLGRSELLRFYPVVYEVPTEDDECLEIALPECGPTWGLSLVG